MKYKISNLIESDYKITTSEQFGLTDERLRELRQITRETARAKLVPAMDALNADHNNEEAKLQLVKTFASGADYVRELSVDLPSLTVNELIAVVSDLTEEYMEMRNNLPAFFVDMLQAYTKEMHDKFRNENEPTSEELEEKTK